LKFFNIDSLAQIKLSFSLFNILLGKITAATAFGFKSWEILSTNNVSISDPLFEIVSNIENELFLSFKWGLNADTEYGGFATKMYSVLYFCQDSFPDRLRI
jgi:hypothetical protein